MIDREQLEADALRTVSAANYYDLADNIDATTGDELRRLIRCNGDEIQEDQLARILTK